MVGHKSYSTEVHRNRTLSDFFTACSDAMKVETLGGSHLPTRTNTGNAHLLASGLVTVLHSEHGTACLQILLHQHENELQPLLQSPVHISWWLTTRLAVPALHVVQHHPYADPIPHPDVCVCHTEQASVSTTHSSAGWRCMWQLCFQLLTSLQGLSLYPSLLTRRPSSRKKKKEKAPAFALQHFFLHRGDTEC